MNRGRLLIASISLFTLLGCSSKEISHTIYPFSTYVTTKLYEGTESNLKDLEAIYNKVSKLSDNYLAADVNNVYTINHTNEEVVIDQTLFDLLDKSLYMKEATKGLFNPFIGSLAKLWKESLEDKKVLSNEVIASELEKMNNTSLKLMDLEFATRSGESEIDLGGIAKGYALDLAKEYLDSHQISKYLIDAGSSSILLGSKNTEDGYFNIGIKELGEKAYLKLKNCVLSSSGISEQGVTIDGVTYSHIINPLTGSAINQHEAVKVISSSGYLGDALSTVLMLEDNSKMNYYEETFNIKVVVIDNGEVTYKSSGIEVLHH